MAFNTVKKYKLLSLNFIDSLKVFYASTLNRLSSAKELRRFNQYFELIQNSDSMLVNTSNNNTSVSFPLNGNNVSVVLRKSNSDIGVFNQIFFLKEYKVVVDLLHAEKSKDLNIVDVGANIGLTSIFLRTFFPKSNIVCLEPEKSNIAMCEENFKKNGLSDIKIIPKGMWVENTHLYASNSFRDGLSWSFSLSSQKNNESDQPIETITLDKLMEDHDLSKIDVLKIDIEGGEKDLLHNESFMSCMAKKVRLTIMEIHPEVIGYEESMAILRGKGFLVFASGESIVGINLKLHQFS